MDFIVDRTRWGRRNSSEDKMGVLLSEEGKLCCLGFVCLQVGIPEQDLLNKTYPYKLFKLNPKSVPDTLKDFVTTLEDFLSPEGLYIGSSNLSLDASSINDCISNDETKEIELKKLFKDYRHTITFIN